MSKIYISGAISGMPNLNKEAFAEAEKNLKAVGFDVVNPHNINQDTSKSWASCMKNDIKSMMDCEAIFMLDGWEKSKGATVEHNLALALKMTVIFQQ